MPFDPATPLTMMEKRTFGFASRRHEITGEPLEISAGAPSPRLQAYLLHLPTIERRDGKEAAAAMRKKLEDADKFNAAQAGMATAKSALASDGVSASSAEKAAT